MSIRRLLTDEVTYRRPTSGTYGPSVGDPVTIPARVQYGQVLVVTKDSTEVTAVATVYVEPRRAPEVGDNLDLPNGETATIIDRDELSGGRLKLVRLRVR